MNDRRQAVRMRSNAGCNQVRLQVRGQELKARLSNASAVGLSVICSSAASIQPGESLKIQMDCGWFAAQVVRAHATPEGLVVGLERGEEVPDPNAVWIRESQLIPLAFVGIVIAVPLLVQTWSYCRSSMHSPPKPARSAQLADPPATKIEGGSEATPLVGP